MSPITIDFERSRSTFKWIPNGHERCLVLVLVLVLLGVVVVVRFAIC